MSKELKAVAVVVPCYNEAERFEPLVWRSLLESERAELILVDDGSSDGTLQILRGFESEQPTSVHVVALTHNQGKAEAVRQGLLRACELNLAIVGYADADMATPEAELWRLVGALEQSEASAVFGARIARLGSSIKRKAVRHYLGRLFATAASYSLQTSVYDTQCGAKFFRCTQTFKQIISDPFESRWAFDVELLSRLLAANQDVIEIPLREWRDVPGSKLKIQHMIHAGLDLVRIAIKNRR